MNENLLFKNLIGNSLMISIEGKLLESVVTHIQISIISFSI